MYPRTRSHTFDLDGRHEFCLLDVLDFGVMLPQQDDLLVAPHVDLLEELITHLIHHLLEWCHHLSYGYIYHIILSIYSPG